MAEFTIERSLAAPLDRVWEAWTDPERLAAWFWPDRFAATCEVDARVGGTLRVHSESAGMGISGEFQVVEPPSRLVFTFAWDGDGLDTLVTLTLREEDGGTHLTLLHERIEDVDASESYREGWESCLDRLDAVR